MINEIDYLKLDRSKFPVMEVSDNGVRWNKKIVILTSNNGSCIAVNGGEEQNFLNGFKFNTWVWNMYRPIKQKKTRYMTPLEVMQFGIDNPNVVYKLEDEEDKNISLISTFLNCFSVENHIYTTLTNGQLGEWKEFLVEVEE